MGLTKEVRTRLSPWGCHYREPVREPVPERILKLLEELEKRGIVPQDRAALALAQPTPAGNAAPTDVKPD